MASLSIDLQTKFDNLLKKIATYEKAVIAFSGGLDSGFLLYSAIKALGHENIMAITGESESFAKNEKDFASQFAASLGLGDRYLVIKTDELSDERYTSNPIDRCFYCKRIFFGKLREIAVQNDFNYILDGCNASDIYDHRPGRRAATQFSVQSPLLDVGLVKNEIREIAKSEHLEIWNKPQTACLASRIPYGERITAEKLAMIEQAERCLRELGFRQMRVRHHDKIARIELEKQDIGRILDDDLRRKIIDRFREIGFLWVTLDLKPFKTGSMNIIIKDSRND